MSDSSLKTQVPYSKEKEYVELIKMLGELDETSLRMVKSGVELLYAREQLEAQKGRKPAVIV